MAFCPNCGNQLKEGAKFCSYCGGQISSLIDSSDENNVLSQVENVNSVESDNHEKAESMPAIQNYVYDDDDMTGLRSKINTNNKKTKHKDKLPSSEKKTKKIIILILCLSLIASGGVAAYLLLSDNAKDDSSSLRTIDNNSIVSSQHENSSLSSDDSSEVKTIEKWETKDLSEPNADLKTTEMMIDRFKRDKYTTGIKVDYDSLSSFLSSRFKSNNAEAKLVDFRNEDIYTRLSDDIDFYGIVGSSEVSVVNGKTDDVIADGSFNLTSAVFDGANELTLHMNYEGTIDEIQQQSKKDLATFVDENMAEYMVYGKGNSIPDIDAGIGNMKYSGTINRNAFNIYLERTIERTENGAYITYIVKYDLVSEEDQKLFFDNTQSYVYDNTNTKIDSFIPGTENFDYKKSHEFLSDILKDYIPEDYKFIDSKLESMQVSEAIDGDRITDTYKFKTAVGISNTKYSEAPNIECTLENTVENNKVSAFNISIAGDTTVTDASDGSKMIVNAIGNMYPMIGSSLKAEEIASKISSHQPFEKEYNVTIFGENIIMKLTVKAENTINFILECEKLSDEEAPHSIPDEVGKSEVSTISEESSVGFDNKDDKTSSEKTADDSNISEERESDTKETSEVDSDI